MPRCAGKPLRNWTRGSPRSNRESVRSAPSYDDLGDFKAYSLFHLGGNYAVTDSLNLSATIYNLFDKDFVDYRAYGDGTSFGNAYANSEEGRRLWLSARYELPSSQKSGYRWIAAAVR